MRGITSRAWVFLELRLTDPHRFVLDCPTSDGWLTTTGSFCAHGNVQNLETSGARFDLPDDYDWPHPRRVSAPSTAFS